MDTMKRCMDPATLVDLVSESSRRREPAMSRETPVQTQVHSSCCADGAGQARLWPHLRPGTTPHHPGREMETLGFRSNCEQGSMVVQSDTNLKSERCKTFDRGLSVSHHQHLGRFRPAAARRPGEVPSARGP